MLRTVALWYMENIPNLSFIFLIVFKNKSAVLINAKTDKKNI